MKKTAGAIAVVLPLACISCHRQSAVEQKQPAVEQTQDSSTSSAPVGTSGDTTPSATDSTATAPASPETAAPAASAGTTAAEATTGTERDGDAIKALEGMSNYLRTLKAFQIRSETSRDEVLENGQNVELSGVVDMIVDRPDRLRAEVVNDKQHRMFFDDGKTFTVWARGMNYYATIPAPATLADLADKLSEKYGLELPLVDLFYWGDRKSTGQITSAIDVGPSQVEGVTCEHYAFRQEGADWQVWIQQGDYPLPRKLVITTTTDPARPKFTSVMTWNLAPSFNDAAFNFVAPKDAKRIMLAEAVTDDSQH